MHLSTPYGLRFPLVKAYLRLLASSDAPILVGPFRSELGFEAMYWLPFLRWARSTFKIPDERLIAVTRGGAGAWYGCLSVDLYSLRQVDEVRLENLMDQRKRGLQKQMRSTAWDKAVLAEAAASLGIKRYAVLHPAWMYWAFEPFWEEYRGLRYAGPRLDFTPIQPPTTTKIDGLPERYVAVRFYSRFTFPDTPVTRDFAIRIVGRIASQVPVVLLHQPNLHADDHYDLPMPAMPNVITLGDWPAERNLELMSALLAKAQAFIGTYGGVAQLALRMGVPSVSFYTEFQGTAGAHLALSRRVSTMTGVPFEALSLAAGGVVKLALREQVVVQPEPPKVAA